MPDDDSVRIVVGDDSTIGEVRKLADHALAKRLEIVFEIEDPSSEMIAVFVGAVDHWRTQGRSVHLVDAPQVLAHTLYKVGRLIDSPRLTISVQGAEPYAG